MKKQSILYMIFRDGLYCHEGKSVKFVSLYDSKAQIDQVTITEDETGNSQYFAWWNSEQESFEMIWPSRLQVEMCFPYGSKAEENRGRGELCCVKIDKIKTENEAGNRVKL